MEAAEVLAPSSQSEHAPDVEEVRSRMRQIKAELLQQQAHLEWQQDQVARTAMAQQQQQAEMATAGSQRLFRSYQHAYFQEQEAMEMGRAPGMTTPEHLPPAGSPRAMSPHQRDVDLPATP